MGFDQFGEILLQLAGAEPVGRAVEVPGNPAHCAGVHVYGAVAFALKLQSPEVAPVLAVEALLFVGSHAKLLLNRARDWAARGVIHEVVVFSAAKRLRPTTA